VIGTRAVGPASAVRRAPRPAVPRPAARSAVRSPRRRPCVVRPRIRGRRLGRHRSWRYRHAPLHRGNGTAPPYMNCERRAAGARRREGVAGVRQADENCTSGRRR